MTDADTRKFERKARKFGCTTDQLFSALLIVEIRSKPGQGISDITAAERKAWRRIERLHSQIRKVITQIKKEAA